MIFTIKERSVMLTQQEYSALAKQADDETSHPSSVTDMLEKPACQAIAHLGVEVLPFLFKDLEQGKSGRLWLMDLIQVILRGNGLPPVEVPDDLCGQTEEKRMFYVNYGYDHGRI